MFGKQIVDTLIRLPYWQRIPHGKVTNNTLNITSKSQEVSPFPAGDHKAAMNRRENMRNAGNEVTSWLLLVVFIVFLLLSHVVS